VCRIKKDEPRGKKITSTSSDEYRTKKNIKKDMRGGYE